MAPHSARLAKQHARLARRVASAASHPAHSSGTCREGLCARLLGQGDAHKSEWRDAAELHEVPTAVHGKPCGLSGTESPLVVMHHGPQVKRKNLK